MDTMNHKIHTADDTLAVSNNNASHAVKFAKMALAYIVELDR
jgi:leucyl aminopeptidase